MDALGLILSAALCTAVFVIFDLFIRLLGDAVGEIRYSVAPALLGGLHAWSEGQEPGSNPSNEPSSGTAPPPDEPRITVGRPDPGLVVPVGPVSRRTARCAGT